VRESQLKIHLKDRLQKKKKELSNQIQIKTLLQIKLIRNLLKSKI